ncbi:hypothetical protein L916_08605, partial [Phytophthora nicotianae]
MAENDVDVDAKNAPAAVADPRSGDAALGTRDDIGTTTAATSTSGVTEQCVDAGKKDAGASAATTVKDDAPVSVADDGNDIADPETRDSNVDEGDANVEDGDAVVDWTVDEADANVDEGDVDAEVDANQECDKRKKRLESQRRKHAPDEEAGEDIGNGRPSKCARTDVKNRGSTATTVKHLRERRRTKTFEDRGEIVKARQGVVNVEPGLPKKSFKSWEEFEQVLHLYEAKHFLHFRVRSSETRARNN